MTKNAMTRRDPADDRRRPIRHRGQIAIAGGLLLLLGLGCGTTGAESRKPAAAAGIAALATVRAVLQHPRCVNCHPQGDAPLQFDDGMRHGQLVARGPDGKGVPGLRCATCHGTENPPASYGDHQPPGAPNWHLPPPDMPMVFQGKSAAELAASLADPKQNGGRSLQAMLEHVRSDPLVLWGWSPGPGRAPVYIPHAEFVAAFATWVEAGAPAGR